MISKGDNKKRYCKESEEELKKAYRENPRPELTGERWEISYGEEGYPEKLLFVKDPPKCLYGIGNIQALSDGLAIVGARRATPYGLAIAK